MHASIIDFIRRFTFTVSQSVTSANSIDDPSRTMFAPPTDVTINVETLPDIFGSISVACWVFVFTPQIYKNWKRSSTDGLATNFLVIWTAGDVCNVVGAIFQNVLPTMIILAMYYILADIALLYQVYIYGGNKSEDSPNKSDSGPERQPLLASSASITTRTRRDSSILGKLFRHFQHPEHSSPATPLIDESLEHAPDRPRTLLQELWFNTYMVLLVIAAGLSGWYISALVGNRRHKHHRYGKTSDPEDSTGLEFDPTGQLFGYLCAALYLGSRIPQILTNYRRRSTEALSLLFIMYACLGNITYDMSIFTFSPQTHCFDGPGECEKGEASAIYRRYLAINASWIIGSLGALLLDLVVFFQFFLYSGEKQGNENGNAGSPNNSRRQEHIDA